MLTQELVEFINSQVEDALPRSEYLSQDYEELLDFVAEKLIENEIEMFVEKDFGKYKRQAFSPLFEFVIERIHQQVIQQATNSLETTLHEWYTARIMESPQTP